MNDKPKIPKLKAFMRRNILKNKSLDEYGFDCPKIRKPEVKEKGLPKNVIYSFNEKKRQITYRVRGEIRKMDLTKEQLMRFFRPKVLGIAEDQIVETKVVDVKLIPDSENLTLILKVGDKDYKKNLKMVNIPDFSDILGKKTDLWTDATVFYKAKSFTKEGQTVDYFEIVEVKKKEN